MQSCFVPVLYRARAHTYIFDIRDIPRTMSMRSACSRNICVRTCMRHSSMRRLFLSEHTRTCAFLTLLKH
eukprot:11211902-Lingulodinium_polyedra.AAC.1